jgi:paraquat-inducible protein B
VPEIPAVPSDLEKLRNQLAGLPLRQLVDTAQQALVSVTRLSDHFDAAIDPLAKSVQRTSDAAVQTLQTTDEAVKRVQADASAALHELDSLLVDARGQLDSRSGDLGRTLTEAERAVRQAETLLNSVNGLVEPRSTFRGDLEAALHDLAASASSLRSFADTVERNPNALLMGRGSR